MGRQQCLQDSLLFQELERVLLPLGLELCQACPVLPLDSLVSRQDCQPVEFLDIPLVLGQLVAWLLGQHRQHRQQLETQWLRKLPLLQLLPLPLARLR